MHRHEFACYTSLCDFLKHDFLCLVVVFFANYETKPFYYQTYAQICLLSICFILIHSSMRITERIYYMVLINFI